MNDFIFKQTKYYHDYRGLQKVMLQMMPSESLVGEPVAVVREKSDVDLLLLHIIPMSVMTARITMMIPNPKIPTMVAATFLKNCFIILSILR